MLLKCDYNMRPERFYIGDLSTPVYLQADGKRFLEFSYNAGYWSVQIRSGMLLNQKEVRERSETRTRFFYSREAAREFIHTETWRYCTEEGFKPADWIPQELNNYIQNLRASSQSPHGTKQASKTSYQLNQIAKEMAKMRLSNDLNDKFFMGSRMEKLLAEGFEGVYLVKLGRFSEREPEIFKIQWRRNVLKIENERGDGKHQKKFWQFESERELLKNVDEKMRKAVEQGYKFKLEKFIDDFYEDESEIQKLTTHKLNTRNSPANIINVIKASSDQRSHSKPRCFHESPSIRKIQQEGPYSIFLKPNQEKHRIFDSKSCKMVADFILEGLENRRKNDSMEVGVGTENQEDYKIYGDSPDFQLVPLAGESLSHSNSSQKQVFSRTEDLVEKPPKQIFQRRQLGFSQNSRSISKNEDGLCVICMDHEASMAFIPCGHKKTCEGCCDMIMGKDASCPVCRMGINSTLRIYE